MKKTISFVAACIGAALLAAGIGLPSASADPTNTPSPNPTVSNQRDYPYLQDDPWQRQFFPPQGN